MAEQIIYESSKATVQSLNVLGEHRYLISFKAPQHPHEMTFTPREFEGFINDLLDEFNREELRWLYLKSQSPQQPQ